MRLAQLVKEEGVAKAEMKICSNLRRQRVLGKDLRQQGLRVPRMCLACPQNKPGKPKEANRKTRFWWLRLPPPARENPVGQNPGQSPDCRSSLVVESVRIMGKSGKHNSPLTMFLGELHSSLKTEVKSTQFTKFPTNRFANKYQLPFFMVPRNRVVNNGKSSKVMSNPKNNTGDTSKVWVSIKNMVFLEKCKQIELWRA